MSAECMSINLASYTRNSLGSCPSSPTDTTYECLCALPSFTSWYLSTLCINCNGGPTPLSSLSELCPSFTGVINATYPDSCSPYIKEDASLASAGVSISSSPTTTSLSGSSSSSSSNLTSSSTSSTLSSSSTTTSSLTTSAPTTVVLSMTTPSPSPSTSSKLSTLTAVAASPIPETHSFIGPSSNSTTLSPTPSSTNATYTYSSTSTPTSPLPITDSPSSSGMSTGAKAGIGVGAAAAAIGIGFVFMSLLIILRRRSSRMKSSGYGRRNANYPTRGVGGGRNGAGDTSTTLAEMYQDDERQFYRGFGGSDGYSASGLGIAGIGTTPREKMGFVPSGRIREVMVGSGDELPSSEFATPLHAEGVREIHHVDERSSEYSEEDFVAPQESDGAWPLRPPNELHDAGMRHSTAQESNYSQQSVGPRYSTAQEGNYERPVWPLSGGSEQEDSGLRYSTAQESSYSQPDTGPRYSTAQESNFEAAMRPKSRIYSVVDSPVLDLGQADLSQEELARLEDEERRIDEAIRESENRARIREQRGSVGSGLR